MGRKHYDQETKDNIVQLRKEGLRYWEIADALSCGIGVVQQTCQQNGITGIKHTREGHPNPKRNVERDEKISELRDDGYSCGAIASMLGLNRGSVSVICKRIGKTTTKEEKDKNIGKHDDVASFIASKVDGIEYVSGYKSQRNPLTVRCKSCGGTFDTTLHKIKYENPKCPHCKAEEQRKRKQAEAERKAQLEIERIAQEEERERIRQERERKAQERWHDCPVCGTRTNRPKYCSKECANRTANARKEASRRIKIETNMVDKDITLSALFNRDGGVCHICGDQCRWDDYTTVNGQKIAGDWYPSIDHVVPISKGGQHSWKNVKLAHRLCNTIKRDMPLSEILS